MTRPHIRHRPVRCVARVGFEALERRLPLAGDVAAFPTAAWTTAAQPAASIWTAAAATSPASALLATVVPYQDTLFGDTRVVTTDARAVARDLAPVGREFRTELPISVANVPLGATVQLEVLTGLTTWNGRGGVPAFRPVPRGLEVNLQLGGVPVPGFDLRVGVGQLTDRAVPPQVGQVRRTLTLAASDGQPLERRIAVTIGTGGVADRFAKPGAAPGLYAFTGLLSIGGVETVRPSQPVTFVFRVGAVPDAAVQAAIASFSSPASGPAAVLAMAARSAGIDRPFSNAILVTVDYSAPVTVSRRSPQLPIFVGGVRRLATLPVDAPRTDVRQLTFSYPLPRDVNEGTVIDIGASLLMPPGATLRTTGGTSAVTSLPTSGSRGIPLEYQVVIAHVSADITQNTVFRAGTTSADPQRPRPGAESDGRGARLRLGLAAPGGDRLLRRFRRGRPAGHPGAQWRRVLLRFLPQGHEGQHLEPIRLRRPEFFVHSRSDRLLLSRPPRSGAR